MVVGGPGADSAAAGRSHAGPLGLHFVALAPSSPAPAAGFGLKERHRAVRRARQAEPLCSALPVRSSRPPCRAAGTRGSGAGLHRSLTGHCAGCERTQGRLLVQREGLHNVGPGPPPRGGVHTTGQGLHLLDVAQATVSPPMRGRPGHSLLHYPQYMSFGWATSRSEAPALREQQLPGTCRLEPWCQRFLPATATPPPPGPRPPGAHTHLRQETAGHSWLAGPWRSGFVSRQRGPCSWAARGSPFFSFGQGALLC